MSAEANACAQCEPDIDVHALIPIPFHPCVTLLVTTEHGSNVKSDRLCTLYRATKEQCQLDTMPITPAARGLRFAK